MTCVLVTVKSTTLIFNLNSEESTSGIPVSGVRAAGPSCLPGIPGRRLDVISISRVPDSGRSINLVGTTRETNGRHPVI